MERDTQDSAEILKAVEHLTHGVYILGTRRGREVNAMTAAWAANVSQRPPCLAVAVRDDRYTHSMIVESGTFALSILRDDQIDVATHFADTSGEYHEKLRGIPYTLTPGGSPVLLDCLAHLDCKVMDTVRAGDHTVFIGEVLAGESLGEDTPLIYDPAEYEEALR